MNPLAAFPFALTSSTARSFQSSSVYSGSVLATPTETVEEKMMIRLMLPLWGFEENTVRTGDYMTKYGDLRGLDSRFQNTKGSVNSGTDEVCL